MADVEWELPDGSIGVFPDTMSDVQIKGIIAHAFPKEVGAAVAANPNRDMTGARPFNGANVPGYDPATGIVSGGAIDDKTGNEFGTGIRQTIESTLGLPGDVGPMAGQGASKLAGQFGVQPEAQGNIADIVSKLTSAMFNPIGAMLPYSNAASTQDIQQAVTDPVLGETGPVLTEKGQIARASGNLAGGAFAPGGVLRKLASMILPVAGGEAGAAVAPKGYEDYARFGGQLVGGALTIPKIGGKPIVEAAKDLGVKTKDMTRVIKRMQQDGMTPQQIQTRLAELGDNATLMDVGPNLRQEGQRIYAKGGAGRGVIDDVLTPRDQGANARIRADVDTNFGPAPVPSQIEAQIAQGQDALGPAYDQVLANGRAADTTQIAHQLESDAVNLRGAAQQQAQRLRRMLDITGTQQLDPNPRTLHEIRKAIDGQLATEADPNAIRVLTRSRADIDRELARVVPGIKDVDAQFAELARQRTALGRGQQTLDSGRTAPRPVELAEEVQQGALPQGTQIGPSAVPVRLRQGNRADIERHIGTKTNNRVALKNEVKGEGSWNRDRLATMYGQEPTDRVISALDRETTFDTTSNRIMKNSATAERLPDGGDAFGMLPSWKSGGALGLARAVVSDLGEAFLDKIRSTAAEARDSGVAKIISGADHNRIVTALIKANGGKPLPQNQIESAVRALLLTSGAKGQSAN